MMSNILWLCMIPIIWAVAAHFLLRNSITMQEAGVKAGVGSFIILVVYLTMCWSQTADTEILNGQVTAKQRNKVSCGHSYKCMCYTTCSGSGNARSCTEHCSTCYEHSYDIDWDVYTTVGNLSINRVDRQGLDQPQRWTGVLIGEPAARENGYKNYLLASPNSLFNMKLAESEAKSKAALIPKYPEVYDYYRVRHVINVNAVIPNAQAWDNQLARSLRTLGRAKQVNITIVFVSGQDRSYKSVLERAWVGAKKNDVTVVINVENSVITWADAFTFAKSDGNAMVAVRMRDELQALGHVRDPSAGIKVIAGVVAGTYVRKPMENYKYLEDEGGPSATAIGWLIGIVLLLLAGATVWFHITDMGMQVYRSSGPNTWDRLHGMRLGRRR